jgi:nitronate monooxygenase
MAGGPTTSELVVAVARVGSIGFLAGATSPLMSWPSSSWRREPPTGRFGVNLFSPNPVLVDPAAYARYRDEMRPDAERLEATVPEESIGDDDNWQDKIALLARDPVSVVSFTFGIPTFNCFAAI